MRETIQGSLRSLLHNTSTITRALNAAYNRNGVSDPTKLEEYRQAIEEKKLCYEGL